MIDAERADELSRKVAELLNAEPSGALRVAVLASIVERALKTHDVSIEQFAAVVTKVRAARKAGT